ncbi:hypothetical protein OH77DRAFT_1431362 [Trametes cingulata]|nr:hypothetical protein OH77DRAFT_1431362 [Trametes cingulata]
MPEPSGSTPAAPAEQASALQALTPFKESSNVPRSGPQGDANGEIKATLPRPVLRLLELAVNFNARAPVNRCPIEIFGMIFLEALDDIEANVKQLVTLTHVCSHWRRIIHGTPALYQSFAIAHPSLTECHLERSLTLPLDIVIDQRGRGLGPTAQNLDLLQPHVGRVRSLRIILDGFCLSTVLLDYLQGLPHHILESLSVANTRSSGRISPSPWSLVLPSRVGSVLRDLTVLCLEDVPLYIPVGAVPDSQLRVRHLELTFKSTAPPSSAELIRFLSCCPELEALLLRSERSIHYVPMDERDIQVVRLPNLKHVYFGGRGYKALVHILRHIRTDDPSPTRFHFELSLLDRMVANYLLPHSIPAAERTVARLRFPRVLRSLQVRGLAGRGVLLMGSCDARGAPFADVSIYIPLYQEGEDEDIDEAEGFTSPTLFWSWPVRRLTRVETLSFIPERSPIGLPESRAQWTSLLKRLPALTTLSVLQPTATVVEHLLAALGPAARPGASLLCPNLRSIVLIDRSGESFQSPRLLSLPDDRVRAGGSPLDIDLFFEL